MSQKNAKRIRRLENRVDTMERSAASWDAAEAAVHNQAALDAAAERNAERRRARDAERAVIAWRRMTYAILAVAIVVEIIAILVVNAEADAEVIDPPMVVATEKTAPEAAEEPEEPENERIEAALLARSHVIEDCAVTHYDCCVQCCGKDDGITASGVRATPGVTVAVDPTVIPLGADVLVDYGDGEIHYFRADDIGVKGNHIDLCVGGHEEALQLGRRTATVYWVVAEEGL